MASMFASAKKVTAPASKAKKEKVQIEIDGLLDLAAVDSLIKKLTAVKETLSADVKSQMSIEFIRMGSEKKDRPKNFEGSDKGLATASCQLRARSSASPLTETEVDLLNGAGLPVETIETTVEAFIINPAYTNDQVVLGKVERALKKIAGLPEDFIMKQDGVSKSIVGANAIEMLFETGDTKKIAAFLPYVSTLSVTPKLEEKANAFEIVRKMLGLGVEEKEAA